MRCTIGYRWRRGGDGGRRRWWQRGDADGRAIAAAAMAAVAGSRAVRGVRPGFWDVRPGKRDALAISQRHGVGGCPLARRKGNVVSYTLLQKRSSQKQRLKRRKRGRKSGARFVFRVAHSFRI